MPALWRGSPSTAALLGRIAAMASSQGKMSRPWTRRGEPSRSGQERETLSVRDVPATFFASEGGNPSAKGGGLAQPQLSRGACPHSPGSVIPGRPGGDTGSPPKCRAQQHPFRMPPLCGHPSTHGNLTAAKPSHQGRR